MPLMSVLTRKAIADVTRRKGRTILMILGIFIGVLGITAVNGANDLFSRDLSSAIGLSFDVFYSVDHVPSGLVSQLEQADNIAAVQTRTVYSTTWHLSGHAGTTPFQINGYQDLAHVQVGSLQLVRGRLPGQGEIAMDTSDPLYSPVKVGDSVTVDTTDGRQATLRVVGMIRAPGLLSSTAQGYMSSDALQQLAPEMSSTVQGQQAQSVLTQQILIKTQNAQNNQQTFYTLLPIVQSAGVKILSAGNVAAQSVTSSNLFLQGLSTIFLVLAAVALVLTCLMILSTMNTMLSEQFKIIGTMKAIGGTRWKIIRSYLLSVSLYALIGTALGLGLGLLLCNVVAGIVVQQTKVDLGPYQVPGWVILISLATGLLAPLLSALLPLLIGTRITVRQAMTSYGINAGGSRGLSATRKIFHGGSQVVQLGIRGVFRKPGRIVLTLAAIMLSSDVFMAVQMTNTSIGASANDVTFVNGDFQVNLGSFPQPYQQVIEKLRSLQHVERVEPFDKEDVQIGDHQARVFGVPVTTHYYQPHLLAGRWLTEDDTDALVISDIASQRLNVHLGDTLTLALGTRKVHWHIVGIVHDLNFASGTADVHGRPGALFTKLETLNTSLRHIPVASVVTLLLTTNDHKQADMQQLRGQIQQTLHEAGLWQSEVQYQSSSGGLIMILYALFDTLMIMVALVGLLGLSNTLAAEVLERRQEIGILRSLGATGGRVSLVFWIEGLVIALLAWPIGIALGFPGGYALVAALNTYAAPLNVSINWLAIPISLLFIIVVSFIASVGPALSASHLRIRDTLRYE